MIEGRVIAFALLTTPSQYLEHDPFIHNEMAMTLRNARLVGINAPLQGRNSETHVLHSGWAMTNG